MTERTKSGTAAENNKAERVPTTIKIDVEVECGALDVAIGKANRLVKLLREARQIISSLSDKEELEA